VVSRQDVGETDDEVADNFDWMEVDGGSKGKTAAESGLPQRQRRWIWDRTTTPWRMYGRSW